MADECILDGIFDSLQQIGYTGELLEDDALETALKGGLTSPDFTKLCHSLCTELKTLNQLQESVSMPTGLEDADSFQLEMRSFLKELGCPHGALVATETGSILSNYRDKLLLIDFLLSELMAARLLSLSKEEGSGPSPMEVDGQQTYSVPANFTAILKAYGLNKPPSHVTVRQIFERIIGRTREALSNVPQDHISGGLVTQPLTQEQWAKLDRINDSLTKEYTVRRQMLLTRCDVTVQSFKWSTNIKGKEEEFSSVYQSLREKLNPTAHVSIAQVLAARQDLLTIEKTSSGASRGVTECAINKVIIGKVPDRGGRPRETRPPLEMPAFRKRTEGQQERQDFGGRGGGRGGSGRGKGGRGGRVQGGWSGGRGSSQGGGWQQGGDGGRHGNYKSDGGGAQHYYS